MATVVVQQQPAMRQSVTPPPMTAALTLNTPRSSTPIPNKHIPFCPPGPSCNLSQIITPPNSPPSRAPPLPRFTSVLCPASIHKRLCTSPPIYGISGETLNEALQQQATQSMLEPSHVFPWMHGLHADNHVQLAFFVGRKKALRRTPKTLRALTIIKAGGDLTRARIKGALAPDEVLSLCDDNSKGFLECDAREGFSVRNFQIQAAKMAQVSDIVIYGDDKTDARIIKSVAERTSSVQRRWRRDQEAAGESPEIFNTFVLTDSFSDFEESFPELIVVDSRGKPTRHAMDFLQWERNEMCEMSKASEISQGVFLGPTPGIIPSPSDDNRYDVLIEAMDHAQMPEIGTLKAKAATVTDQPISVAFPSSGSILPPSWSQVEVNGILNMCKWIYDLTHATMSVDTAQDEDGDIHMSELSSRQAKVLIHCADGYTESTLLGMAYFMYAEGLPVHSAWIKLHKEKTRNFFAYPSDVALMVAMQDRILSESPACHQSTRIEKIIAPPWLARLDGSLPSRVLPYMYLGNLTHANNPQMLRALGIRRILSVGEPVSWTEEERNEWGPENLKYVDRVQDNGIDELSPELHGDNGSLKFIGECERQPPLPFHRPALGEQNARLTHLSTAEQGKIDGTATLVHCRVGVSRSATICIAEVMKTMGLNFPRA